MVELDSDQFGFKGEEKTTAESGILVQLPDKFNYYGMWSFAFESSFMDQDNLQTLHKYWESKIGRRVFWTALSEKGNIIQKDGKRYAFVKLTSLIAEDEPNSDATNVYKDGQGGFSV